MLQQNLKNTELGKIPIEWELESFENIAVNKGLIRGPFGGALKKEMFKPSGYKVYEQQNAIYQSIDLGNYFIDQQKYSELKRFAVKANDFILSCSGTIGKLYHIPNNFKEGVINQALLLIRLDSSKIDYKYFENQFNSNIIQNKILNVQGGAMKNLVGMDQIRKVKFIIPSLPEQKAIADCLSTWDEAIEKQTKLIAAKEQRKKALMQQLLSGKKRLPGFTETWKNYTLGSLGSTFNGLTGKNKEDFGEGQPFITYLNIFQNPVIDISTFDLVKINLGERQNRVKYGDIFFTVSSETQDEVGMASVLLQDVEDLYLNSFCFGYRLHNFDTLLPEFSSYFFRAYNFRKELFKLSQGATRYNLSKNNLMLVEILVPNVKEQKLISDILFTAEKEISAEKIRLVNFKRQKKALMQNLLSGKVRLVS